MLNKKLDVNLLKWDWLLAFETGLMLSFNIQLLQSAVEHSRLSTNFSIKSLLKKTKNTHMRDGRKHSSWAAIREGASFLQTC